MKKLASLLFLFSFLCTFSLTAQDQPSAEAEPQFETFEMQEGDTTYVMKKYFMVFLKTGPNRSQDKEEAAKIQAAHLAHMNRLAEENKICIAGPFDSDGDIRGIVIYSAYSLEEAEKLTQEDPAVKAGRLLVEVHPFWAAKGSKLF